ncbi:hypothetical protein CYLTODRAFT_365976 [Cylindrobasidium torrendii FP15055 ss-10]|uniref:Uncharacterized protein n=1 Tax=Cylindrobasidium torrendii FP15055 ss-10 TaxID=1314674 RepID=A0A0D7BSN8_9AGAR|nr:hypothetical protein CYLTODRAFT_365976 [Cylindrobasidium torrendii FP15055 ss-10]
MLTDQVAAVHQAYAADPKYKKYTQQVDKCLNSFDNVHEWADCIAFLKLLLKTFQSYMQFKEIPRKVVVAKRLAQCLNPALPTGVHQRALDVYAHILPVLGSDGLKHDLPLWSLGLFPFFEYAATSVKPTLLNLYDTHYLPLQDGLRPIMKAFIIALLPGLEEETGEFFEKVLSLLDRLSGAVSPSFFFQNIWLVMLTAPSSRGTALNFLARRLPSFSGQEDIAAITSIVGQDIGLMIRAFSAALEDDNLLVRRGALDILVQSLRLEGVAIRKAHQDDRNILMRAATSVVLRRDLSLNRRLYTWLLGPSEKTDEQTQYLRTNGLELLRRTLEEEMVSPSNEYSESRPFKIFISLLDKWEIGALVTEVLVCDALKAIKKLIESGGETAEDLTMTASTLYEAVEPPLLWKPVLEAMFSDILSTAVVEDCTSVPLTSFLLSNFSQDEEMSTVHIPIVFSALVDLLQKHLEQSPELANHGVIRHTFSLLQLMVPLIHQSVLLARPSVAESKEPAGTDSSSPYAVACAMYGVDAKLPTSSASPYTQTFSASFESLVVLSEGFARAIVEGRNVQLSREFLCSCVQLMTDLVVRVGPSEVTVSWNPEEWLTVVLECLQAKSTNFLTIDRTVSLLVALCEAPALKPNVYIDNRLTMHTIMSKLIRYLRADSSPYHGRAVTLIWNLEEVSKKPHVESILAETMTANITDVAESYEMFGVLWRLTDDQLLPGFKFKVPLMIVLDALKSEEPSLKRVGETWMRCSLKSYLRVLDPILFDLLDPAIIRTATTMKVHTKELQGFYYERAFDQRYIYHILEMLLSVVRFGGQGFAKTARSTPVKRSQHAGLVERVENSGLPDADASYLEVLVELLLRLLQTEPTEALTPMMQPRNNLIHSTAVELLQTVVARGEVDALFIESIEAAVVGKLYYCIHLGRLDLQNKLLHVLHSLITASTLLDDRVRRNGLPKSDSASQHETLTVDTKGYGLNPLLVQTLVDGISVTSNRPVLQHWLDFVLMAIPQFQPTLQSILPPLTDCVCRQLQGALEDVLEIVAKGKEEAADDDMSSSITDAELVMLLNGLERLVLLSLTYTTETATSDEEVMGPEKSATEGGGLLGYVSGVFGSENPQSTGDDQLSSRSPGYRALQEAVRVLYSIWGSLAPLDQEPNPSTNESLALIYTRVRLRCRRVLEHLFRVQAPEVFEAVIECWHRDVGTPAVSSTSAFDLTDVLISSAQNAVHMMCESIASRVPGMERTKRQAMNPDLSDPALFKFLEQYLGRLEGPIALQVWNRFLQLTKDVMGAGREFKPQQYAALRCLTVLADKVTQTTAVEDRRIRKDLQETYGKLLDACVSYVGRSFDQGSWIRRSAKDALVTNGRESPAPREKIDDKLAPGATTITTDSPRIPSSNELILQITEYVSTSIVPHLRRFLADNDKVLAACSNIVYYVVTPSMKGKTRPLDVDTTTLAIIKELCRIHGALKAWRPPVVELLYDNRLFNGNAEVADDWRPIFKSLFDADKTAFSELLGKVATSPSTNIFTNKEYEMLLRSLNLRRLAFVIFTGDKNQFLTQLPSIQEKLVDTLRNVSTPTVQSEVYLCLRVLLCRLSPHNLMSFWPTILMELYRLFQGSLENVPADGSEELQLVLAACKCLDLLFTLQTEEFQIYQWVFMTDTVDAIYRPNDWHPAALLDQLAEIVGGLPAADSNKNVPESTLLAPARSLMRRPLLNDIRQVETMRELGEFFGNVSLSTYESVYGSGGVVDWESVERGIMDDMFDGR